MEIIDVRTERAVMSSGLDVMIDARGKRGGCVQWTVKLSRKGHVRCGIQTAPRVLYVAPEGIPDSIRNAAVKAWAKEAP